tara:strand:+ start:1213 stop:1389 length:177 start_codon:yes stop_codon:yes gene_type:complete
MLALQQFDLVLNLPQLNWLQQIQILGENNIQALHHHLKNGAVISEPQLNPNGIFAQHS